MNTKQLIEFLQAIMNKEQIELLKKQWQAVGVTLTDEQVQGFIKHAEETKDLSFHDWLKYGVFQLTPKQNLGIYK